MNQLLLIGLLVTAVLSSRVSIDKKVNSLDYVSNIPFVQYVYQDCTTGARVSTPTESCQPFILGGWAVATCNETGIDFEVFNWEGCGGGSNGIERSFNTHQCYPYGNNTFEFRCILAPYFGSTICTSDNQCKSGCGPTQFAPLDTCEPFFLGGYAIASYEANMTLGEFISFDAYQLSDCSDPSVSTMVYEIGTCSNFITEQNTLAFISFDAVPNP
eukprot:GILI01030131.1.p1 GENE.GILI01030131.1~~GILI01030131.1.p1  ORF type:complete len:215 (+),score=10.79 GILI01030131.1:56-700(+)